MAVIRIETRDGCTVFQPGEEVSGTVRWRLDPPPRSVEARLFWFTEGTGERDVGVVESVSFADPGPEDERPFRFQLPGGPYSFSGKIIRLHWAIEVVAEPRDQAERLGIIMSPSGREIVLPTESKGAGTR